MNTIKWAAWLFLLPFSFHPILLRGAVPVEKIVYNGHSGAVTTVVFSPDGQLIASGSDDHTVIIRKRDGSRLHSLTGHSKSIEKIQFSPDGKYLASVASNSALRIWRVSDGKQLRTITGKITSFAFSPDGTHLATASFENKKGGDSVQRIRLWKFPDGTVEQQFKDESFAEDVISDMAYSADGEYLLYRKYDSTTFTILDSRLELIQRLEISGASQKIAVSPSNPHFVVYSKDEVPKATIWDINTGKQIQSIALPGGELQSVIYSSDGTHLITASAQKDSSDALKFENSVKIWRVSDGRLTGELKGQIATVSSIASSADGRFIVSGALDETVCLWDATADYALVWTAVGGTGEKTPVTAFAKPFRPIDYAEYQKNSKLEIFFKRGHSEIISALAISPDGNLIASASVDKTVKLWSINGILLRTLEGHDGTVTDVAFSHDGRLLASAGDQNDEKIIVWDLNGEQIATLQKDSYAVNGYWSVAFSPDDRFLVSGKDGGLALWDVKKRKLIRRFEIGSTRPTVGEFSPDGKYILSGDGEGSVKVWRADGTLVRTHQHTFMHVSNIAFSSDGKFYGSCIRYNSRRDGKIRIWNALDGSLYRTFDDYGFCRGLSFSPNSQRIASTRYEQQIIVKHLYDDTQNEMFEASTHKIYDLTFSPDGRFLLYDTPDNNKSIFFRSIDGNLIRTIQSNNVAGRAVAVSADGTKVARGTKNNTIEIWKIHGELVAESAPSKKNKNIEDGRTHSISSIQFSPDGRYVAGRSSDRTYRVWKEDGTLLKTFRYPDDVALVVNFWVEFTPNSEFMLVRSNKEMAADVWRLADMKKLGSYPTGFRNGILKITEDGKFMTTVSMDPDSSELLSLWNLETGDLIAYLPGVTAPAASVALSPSGKYVATGDYHGNVSIWDTETLKLVGSFVDKPSLVFHLEFSPDDKYLVSSVLGGMVSLRRVSDGRLIKVFDDFTKDHWFGAHSQGRFVLDGNHVLLWSRDTNVMKIWNIRKHSYSRTTSPGIDAFQVFGNKKYVLLEHQDQRISIWNVESDTRLTLIPEGKEWIIYTSDGYWDGSANGGDLVSMRKGLTAFHIDQFAVRNNRPDIILKRLALGDQTLINHYYQQYRKRLRKLGLKESDLSEDFHVPEAEILEKNQDGKFVDVKFVLRDSKFHLKQYHVYINDVPIFGTSGKPLETKDAVIEERIELTAGKNKIEVSCMNEKGVESYRAVTYADYRGTQKGNLYFLGFGISSFENPSLNLRYAHKDVQDLAAVYEKMAGKGFKKVFIRQYLDAQVTVDNIRNAKQFIQNAGVDDTFVLFISGHGVHDSNKEATYYYLTHNADPNDVSNTAADFELIEDLMQGIKPRKKLFLMDTCESGEADETTVAQNDRTTGGKGLTARAVRGLRLQTENSLKRTYIYQKSRFIFNDLLRRSGAIVISSSKGGEFSYETDTFENGLFTESIVEAYTSSAADRDGNGQITTDELQAFVVRRVPLLSNDKQHPTVDRDNLYMKFSFPVVQK